MDYSIADLFRDAHGILWAASQSSSSTILSIQILLTPSFKAKELLKTSFFTSAMVASLTAMF